MMRPIVSLLLLATAAVSPTTAQEQPWLSLETGGHTSVVHWLRFTPDGRNLISAGKDKVIRVWDVSDPARPRLDRSLRFQIGPGIEGMIYASALAPRPLSNGIWPMAMAGHGTSAPGDSRGAIRLVDFNSGRVIRTLLGDDSVVLSLAFSPDGKTLASGCAGYTIRVWDLTDFIKSLEARPAAAEDAVVGKADEPEIPCQALVAHTDEIGDLAFTRLPGDDASVALVAASNDTTLSLWGQTEGRWQRLRAFLGHTGPVYCMACSPDGRYLVSSSQDGTDVLWDIATGERLRVLGSHRHGDASVAFAPDGRNVVCAAGCNKDQEIVSRVYRIPEGEEICRFGRHDNHVLAAAVSPDGQLVASFGGNQDEIYLWDPRNGEERACIRGSGRRVYSVALSEDGRWAAFGHTNNASSLRAECPLEHTFDLWDVQLGSPLTDSADANAPAGTAPGPSWRKAILQWENTSVTQSLTHTLTLTWQADKHDGDHQANSSQGKGLTKALLDVGKHLIVGDRGDTVSIERSQAHDEIRCYSFVPGEARREHPWIVVGSNYYLTLHDARTGDILRTFTGHLGDVWSVAVSTDGRFLVSGSCDETFRLWSLENVQTSDEVEPLLSVAVTADDEWIAWTPQGYYKSSPQGDRLIGWHVNRGVDRPADFFAAWQFKRKFNRPDVLERILETASVEKAFEAAENDRAELMARNERLLNIQRDLPALEPPQISVLEPRNGATLRGDRLHIRAHVQTVGSQKSLEVHVRMDGRPIDEGIARGLLPLDREEPTAAPSNDSGKEVVFDVTLPPGKHKFEVFARTDNSTSSPIPLEVTRLDGAETEEKPDLYILAVGVSQYQDSQLTLAYPQADAEGIVQAFRDQAGGLYGKVEVRLLTNEKADRRAVLEGLDWLGQSCRSSKDLAFAFLAGHGVRDQRGRYYFAPYDFDREHVSTTGVHWTALVDSLRSLPAKVILAMDTCHSGAIRGWSGSTYLGKEIGELTDVEGGVVVMTSSLDTQASVEHPDWGHGAFTLALIEGLTSHRQYQGAAQTQLPADYNGDAIVQLVELDAYLTNRVNELTQQRQKPVTERSGASFPMAWVK